MGFKDEVKKATGYVEDALKDPKNLINPMYSVRALDKSIENDRRFKKTVSAMRAAAAQQAEADAAEQEFQNDLDHKRRVSKRTNVIFAGLLGNNDEIGLGGQKNLLGL